MLRRSLVALAITASALPVGIAPADTESKQTRTREARLTPNALPSLERQMRRSAKAIAKAEAASPAAYPPILQRIAACESGGNPAAVGGGGMYRGLFQFAVGTWRSVGGSGDPAQASVAEQYKRAAILLARSGPGQWPVCAA
jgi:Transglycosylase-like domain